MPIAEKITQEDLILWEILRNPVLCTEFVNNLDRESYQEEFSLSEYQKEMMLDFNSYVSICTARATGKTVVLSSLIFWTLILNIFPGDYVVYLVPGKAQLDPVWANLTRYFRTNSFLKEFIAPNAGVNSSEFRITILNGATLLCRIAGQSGTGINVIGLHTPCVYADEAGYLPWNVFMEMQPIINAFTKGFSLKVSGVPTGLREKNVLYHCDQENSNYSHHRVSSYENPRMTERDKQFAIEQYGGEDSDDFIHYFLGMHGKPVFSLFDRSMMSIETYPVYRISISGIELKENLNDYIVKMSLFPGMDKNYKCIMGIDLGYTEPSVIIIMYLDNQHRLRFHGRVRLEKVSYPIQERLIDLLDSKFNPYIIGIDKGSAGISVVQRLMESNEFAHKNYKSKLIPVDFSSWITLGINAEGEEIKSKTKPFATSVLQDYTNNQKIIYSYTDQDMITELERMTYTKTPTGDIVYRTLTQRGGKRGEDHATSALLCASLAYYIKNEYILQKPERTKLIGFSWLVGG